MELTKQDIEYLKALKDHPWYKVLERLENEATINLWKLLLSWNLEDQANLDIIKRNQIYHTARKDFFKNIEKHIREIYTPDI